MATAKREGIGKERLQAAIISLPKKFQSGDLAKQLNCSCATAASSLSYWHEDVGLTRSRVNGRFVYAKQSEDGAKRLADAMGYKVPAGIGLAARRVIGPTNVKYEAA